MSYKESNKRCKQCDRPSVGELCSLCMEDRRVEMEREKASVSPENGGSWWNGYY